MYYGKSKDKNSMKACVMCGQSRSCYKTRKQGNETSTPYILSASRGVCSSCEAAVWLLVEEDRHIKLCQQCRNFYPLAALMEKGTQCLLGSCTQCRFRIDKLKRAKREANKHFLEEKSADQSENSSTLGKTPQSAELSDISDYPSLKRMKVVTHVESQAGAEKSLVAKGPPSLHVATDLSSTRFPPPTFLLVTKEGKGMNENPSYAKKDGDEVAAISCE